jgi:hypothetical protein
MTAPNDWPDRADEDAPPDPDSLTLDRDQLAHVGEMLPADIARRDDDARPDEAS